MPEDVGNELKRMAWARRSAQVVHDDWLRRTTHWRLWKRRLSDFDAIARGEFHVVFPNERSQVERAKVPNIVQLKLDDLAQQAVHAVQTFRCDATSEKSKPKAAKRERIAAWYAVANRMDQMRPTYLVDLAGCGAAFRIVLPNFATKMPCIRRVDPRFAFPDQSWSADRGMSNLLVAYKQTRGALAAEYPALESELRQNPVQGETDQVDVLEYYDSSELLRVAVVPGRGGSKGRTVELDSAPNLLSRAPICLAARTTHDLEFRGVFDQVLGVLNAENRMQNLLIDAAADWISSPVIEYDIENPEDWGTGAILHARSKDSSMRRMTPAMSNPAVFQTLNEMKGDSRAAAVYPEVRSGIARQSIVSAAGMKEMSGTFDSEVAALLKADASASADALSLCFEVDERYFRNEKRYIQGSVNGASFAESYVPAADIRGEYRIRVEVPGAGEDPFSREIRLTQQANNGLIPKRIAREQLQSVKDVLEAEKILLEEQLLAAGVQFIQAQAAQGSFAPAAALIKTLRKPDSDILLTLAQFSDFQQAQQQPQQGTEAFQEAGAMMRGGQGNVPGVGALPPAAPGAPPPAGQASSVLRPGLPPLSQLMVR